MTIAKFTFNNQYYQIRATKHATDRMKDREITKEIILNTISKMKLTDLNYGINLIGNIALIDKENNISLILDIDKKEMRIVTILKKSNIRVKPDTKKVVI